MWNPVMSEITSKVATSLSNDQPHIVTSYRKEQIQGHAALCVDAGANRGGALDNCIRFIYGTKIDMCRPDGEDATQRANYSGHKRKHCLGYHTVTVPDGRIVAQ